MHVRCWVVLRAGPGLACRTLLLLLSPPYAIPLQQDNVGFDDPPPPANAPGLLTRPQNLHQGVSPPPLSLLAWLRRSGGRASFWSISSDADWILLPSLPAFPSHCRLYKRACMDAKATHVSSLIPPLLTLPSCELG